MNFEKTIELVLKTLDSNFQTKEMFGKGNFFGV